MKTYFPMIFLCLALVGCELEPKFKLREYEGGKPAGGHIWYDFPSQRNEALQMAADWCESPIVVTIEADLLGTTTIHFRCVR